MSSTSAPLILTAAPLPLIRTSKVELAPQVGALMVAVEHRYYGASMPTGREFSTEKLRCACLRAVGAASVSCLAHPLLWQQLGSPSKTVALDHSWLWWPQTMTVALLLAGGCRRSKRSETWRSFTVS